jgi:outer membrane protein assembly factor BamB
MTRPDNTNLEQRLIAALQQEASLAMTMTDTQRELERLQHDLEHRRNRQRVIVAVAAAAAAVAVVLGLTFGLTGSDDRRNEPLDQTPIAPRTATLTAVDPVPNGTEVTKAKGPVNPGSVAFGAVWATGLESTANHIYRLDAATGEILSTASFTPIDNVIPLPVRVGDMVLVPAMQGEKTGYAAFDRTGEQAGFIAADNAGLIAGDATGGWIQRGQNRIARLDATGLRVERTVTLPDPDNNGVLVRGLAVAGDALYVAMQIPDSVYRLDAATGEVVDSAELDAVPSGVVATQSGAYVSTEDYRLMRVDTTLRVTAEITGLPEGSFFMPIVGPGDSIWATPNLGGIVELDATTLEPVRSFQILPNAQAGWDFGGAVTDKRLFVGTVQPQQVASIPIG